MRQGTFRSTMSKSQIWDRGDVTMLRWMTSTITHTCHWGPTLEAWRGAQGNDNQRRIVYDKCVFAGFEGHVDDLFANSRKWSSHIIGDVQSKTEVYKQVQTRTSRITKKSVCAKSLGCTGSAGRDQAQMPEQLPGLVARCPRQCALSTCQEWDKMGVGGTCHPDFKLLKLYTIICCQGCCPGARSQHILLVKYEQLPIARAGNAAHLLPEDRVQQLCDSHLNAHRWQRQTHRTVHNTLCRGSQDICQGGESCTARRLQGPIWGTDHVPGPAVHWKQVTTCTISDETCVWKTDKITRN